MGRKASTPDMTEQEQADLAKTVFLAGLVDALTITAAAHVAGVDRATVYRWRDVDTEFAAAWDDALECGTDWMEQEAIHRATHGVEEPVVYKGQFTPVYEMNEDGSPRMVEIEEPDEAGGMRKVRVPVQARDAEGNLRFLSIRKPSDNLLMFMLKARRPEKYRERVAAELTGAGGKDLNPAPAGVLVVPGLMADTAAWSAAAQAGSTKGSSGE